MLSPRRKAPRPEPLELNLHEIKNEFAFDFLEYFSDKNEIKCLNILLDNIKNSSDFINFMENLKIFLRDICIYKNTENSSLLAAKNKELQISQISYKITDIQSEKLIEICDDFIMRVNENANFKISLCAFNAKCWEEIH